MKAKIEKELNSLLEGNYLINNSDKVQFIGNVLKIFEKKNKELIEELIKAKEIIRIHYGLGMSRNQEKTMWQIYNNNSPEMRKINEVIKTKINERDKII